MLGAESRVDMSRSRSKLLARSPANTSRTSVSAISPTTSTARACARARPAVVPGRNRAARECRPCATPAVPARPRRAARSPGTRRWRWRPPACRGRPADARNACRDHLQQKCQRPAADKESAGTSRSTKHQALRDQLAHERARCAPESGADGDFALARRCACEQQARDIRTGDRQHESDSSQQSNNGAANVADNFVTEPSHRDPASLIALGKATRLLRRDRGEILLCL